MTRFRTITCCIY